MLFEFETRPKPEENEAMIAKSDEKATDKKFSKILRRILVGIPVLGSSLFYVFSAHAVNFTFTNGTTDFIYQADVTTTAGPGTTAAGTLDSFTGTAGFDGFFAGSKFNPQDGYARLGAGDTQSADSSPSSAQGSSSARSGDITFVASDFAAGTAVFVSFDYAWDGTANALPTGSGTDTFSLTLFNLTDGIPLATINYAPQPTGTSAPIIETFAASLFTVDQGLTEIVAATKTYTLIWQLTEQNTPDATSRSAAGVDNVTVIPFEFSPALGFVTLGSLFGFSFLRKRKKNIVKCSKEDLV